jgi:hypothetical protein
VEISLPSVIFRINVDFEESNVDTILNECRFNTPVSLLARGGKRNKILMENNKTPLADSIDVCFNVLCGDANRETGNENTFYAKEKYRELWYDKKVSMIETYGLCQGTCSMKFECDYEDFTPSVIEWVKSEIKAVFEKFVIYYDEGCLV